MSIIDLLQQVGAENIQVQDVEESLHSAKAAGVGGVVISVGTNAITPQDVLRKVTGGEFRMRGLVIWFAKERDPRGKKSGARIQESGGEKP